MKSHAEARGRRFERIAALIFEGTDPKPAHIQLFGSQPITVTGQEGWIGVPPVTELDLFTLGPEA